MQIRWILNSFLKCGKIVMYFLKTSQKLIFEMKKDIFLNNNWEIIIWSIQDDWMNLIDSRWLNEFDRIMTTTNLNNWIWLKLKPTNLLKLTNLNFTSGVHLVRFRSWLSELTTNELINKQLTRGDLNVTSNGMQFVFSLMVQLRRWKWQ